MALSRQQSASNPGIKGNSSVSLLSRRFPTRSLPRSSPPPSKYDRLRALRIAIIGASITGITSAAHCIGHGFSNITIFESGPFLGGIWTTGPSSHTSLQINSMIYRPSIPPSSVENLSRQYSLKSKTLFNTKVEDIYQDHHGKWIINSSRFGRFDGVICCLGTAEAPRVPRLPGMDRFLRAGGEVCHSSRLGGGIAGTSAPTKPTMPTPPTITEPKVIATARKCDARDRKVVIIDAEKEGSGLIEALEFAAVEGAQSVSVLLAGKKRGNKWLVPRGVVGDVLLMTLGRGFTDRLLPEVLLHGLFYRSTEDVMATLDMDGFEKLRSMKIEWITCSINHFTNTGININCPRGARSKLVTAEFIDADVVVMVTGYNQPQLTTFLPGTCFPPTYRPPKWYLGSFPTNHPSIACVNHGRGGIFGNWEIALRTRILLMFTLDPRTIPSPFWMRRWIDLTRVLKAGLVIGNFEIFSHVELICWFVLYVALNPFRWKWVFFVLFGIELLLPGSSKTGPVERAPGTQNSTNNSVVSKKPMMIILEREVEEGE
ncbi:hypothetical protein QBC38DRAFT_467632 [Podospora fimiseda]|uniref:Monooxygenase n=1 Tax=Podospora fimiseda TaxID=252190 RepID=A0AAN7BWL4_9PEZI|nr:hypothetical protein QBC38DRAFT_467632 [Podospora fimiseda]